MFGKNKQNYFALSRLEKFGLRDNGNQTEIVLFSTMISTNVKVTAFFGVIEKLVITADIERLEIILNQCDQYIRYLSSENYDVDFCLKFKKVIKDIIDKLSQSYESTTTLLKQLYSKKQNIAAYLNWLTKGEQDHLIKYSQQFGTKIVLYNISNTQLVINKQIDHSQGYDNFDVRILQIQESACHLLYCLSLNGLDSISRMYFHQRSQKQKVRRYQLQINQLKNQSSQYRQIIQQTKTIQNRCKQLEIYIHNQEIEKNNLHQQNKKLKYNLQTQEEQIKTIKDQYKKLQRKRQQLQQQIQIIQIRNKRGNMQNRLNERSATQIIPRNQNIQQNKHTQQNRRGTTVIHLNFSQIQPSNLLIKQQDIQHDRQNELIIQSQPSQTTFGYKRDKPMKTDFLSFEMSQKQKVDQCSICEDDMINYSMFQCHNHFFCLNCIVSYIQSTLGEGNLPKCFYQGCGNRCEAKCDLEVTLRCLRQNGKRQLSQKLDNACLKKQYQGKLFDCPVCKNLFEIDERQIFIQHCGKMFCRKCGQEHGDDQKCDESRYITFVSMYQFPNVCPRCCQLYDKDDKCDHVVCKTCQQKDPQGFCASCSAPRYQTLSHDACFHRKDCRFYNANPQPLKRQAKCLDCNKLPASQHCTPPEQTLKQFLESKFSPSFVAKFFQRRQQYNNKKKGGC